MRLHRLLVRCLGCPVLLDVNTPCGLRSHGCEHFDGGAAVSCALRAERWCKAGGRLTGELAITVCMTATPSKGHAAITDACRMRGGWG